jgi:trk system potassium uptake protein TrkH
VTRMKSKIRQGKGRGGTGIIAAGFLLVILVGFLFLMLPVSSRDGSFTNPLDAAFTAVSATCVTGLVTLDTAEHWSTFGQIVILIMIQTGGLGFMTVAVLLSMLVGRAVTPKERMLLGMSFNLGRYDKLRDILHRIAVGTFCFELSGAILLSTRFIPRFGFWDGLYKSIFHSVSAFCNAGFDLLGSGLMMDDFGGDPVVCVTLMLLVVVGGIGFIVWDDIADRILKKRRLSAYSRLVLIVTAVLIVGGMVLFAVLEWNNQDTIGNLPAGKKVLAALFQSVNLRTSGFLTINPASLSEGSRFLSVLLMFIGGASGSTAGGIKVATVGVLLYTIWSVTIGNREAVLFKRKISAESFMRAAAVVGFQFTLIFAGTLAIVALQSYGIMDVLFESTSVVSTTGLTLGITSSLGTAGKIIVMFLMYLGRVGILTVTYSVMLNLRESRSTISYPDANILIG